LSINNSLLVLPCVTNGRTSVWAQYTLRVNNRDNVQEKLKENGIPTAVHYPTPLYMQECFQYLGCDESDFSAALAASKCVLSLPMNPYLSEGDISWVVKALNEATV